MKGGGYTPSPFTISTITYKVAVYALAETADILPLFLLYPCMYSVFELDIFFGRKGDIWKPPSRPFQLSSTLNPRQAAACDGRRLHLRCPEGTKVSHAYELCTSFQECWHTYIISYTKLGRIGDYSTYSTTNLSIDKVGNRLSNGK